MPIKNRFAELLPEITAWRRDIHAHPELLFDVPRTAAFVAEKLRSFGVDDVTEGIGRSGVVGVIRGKANGSGRTIGLRADMDALPMTEATGLPYASQVPGKMHACGHDGHTAMLLGAAKYLSETRNFDGEVVVIFQPAEEGGGGGREMVEDGLMDRWDIDEIYGMHNVPGRPVGEFAIRPGPFYAAADQFEIVVEGRGGHAAQPHQTVDATLMASHVVIALQTIASRNVDPTQHVVVSVTAFETSTKAHNVVAQSVALRGTVRTFDEEVRDVAEARLSEIAQGTAATFGGEARVDYRRGYPAVVNSADNTAFAAEAAASVSGHCDAAAMYMWGEDFSYMLNKRPGAYIHLGNGDSAPLHHTEYNFNDDAIPAGCSWFAELAERRLALA